MAVERVLPRQLDADLDGDGRLRQRRPWPSSTSPCTTRRQPLHHLPSRHGGDAGPGHRGRHDHDHCAWAWPWQQTTAAGGADIDHHLHATASFEVDCDRRRRHTPEGTMSFIRTFTASDFCDNQLQLRAAHHAGRLRSARWSSWRTPRCPASTTTLEPTYGAFGADGQLRHRRGPHMGRGQRLRPTVRGQLYSVDRTWTFVDDCGNSTT